MQVTATVMGVGFSFFFGWIIKKLVSPSIRAEFQKTESPYHIKKSI
jgi:hypothetical protein